MRDKTPSVAWREVAHHIFEVPHANGGLFERLEKVKPYTGRVIKIVQQIPLQDKKHLQSFLEEIEQKVGEGVVVRDPHALYIDKRTNKALKVKTFHDTECQVVGYSEGKGKYKKMLGAIKCQMKNGIRFKIGTGLSDKLRANPPKIGTVVTFKYQSFTKYGKPRFPVFLRVKNVQ